MAAEINCPGLLSLNLHSKPSLHQSCQSNYQMRNGGQGLTKSSPLHFVANTSLLRCGQWTEQWLERMILPLKAPLII